MAKVKYFSRISAILSFSPPHPNSETIPMRTLCLLIVGVVVGWAASGVDWSRDAVGQEPAIDAEAIEGATLTDEPARAPGIGGERSIRRERDGILRRRGILPPREAPAPADAPPFEPTSDAPVTPAGNQPYSSPAWGPTAHPSFGPDVASGPALAPADEATLLIGRYQVSAYGSPSSNGCYIIDTATGRVWRATNRQPPQFVGELPPQQPSNSTVAPPLQSTLTEPAPMSSQPETSVVEPLPLTTPSVERPEGEISPLPSPAK
jgi:hypothetical protein